mgnify:CR=1 FL=1
MDKLDVDLLMELQYRYPLVPEPYKEIAERLKTTEEDVLRRIIKLQGVIKRIGAYVSFRAVGKTSALVAARVDDVNRVLESLRSDDDVSHCYEREHYFNLWYVIKSRNKEELVEKVDKQLRGYEHLILYSKRTYKLSVKFDLIEGISRSPPEVLPERIPRLEGNEKFLSMIRRFPLSRRPFRDIGLSLGMNEDDVIDLLERLISIGAVRDVGAALDGDLIGFSQNCMLLISSDEPDKVCRRIALEIPEATHVVLRETPKEWKYNCYAVFHSRDKEKAEEIISAVVSNLSLDEFLPVMSRRNLKPGVIR